MALMTGFLGLAVGAVAGWIASRRSSIPESPNYSLAISPPNEEEVIDLRESQLTIELRTDLRKAEARIQDLERTNAELHADVERKNQAVVEARNTLRSVRDSLASNGTIGPIPDLGDDPGVTSDERVVPEHRVGQKERVDDAEPEQSFDDLHKRLRHVTGELAEVTRRHRGEA